MRTRKPQARTPCRGCGGDKPPGKGLSYCSSCPEGRARMVLRVKYAAHDREVGERLPCARCGGEKPPGQARRLCDACVDLPEVAPMVPAGTRAEMVRLYTQERLSLLQVGEAVAWSSTTVRVVLLAEGVTLRRANTVQTARRLKDADVEPVVELYCGAGLSLQEIADRLGIGLASAHRRLKRAGVTSRSGSEGQRLKRLRELEQRGKDALSDGQRAALNLIELDIDEALTTREIAGCLQVSEASARAVLIDLRSFGLIKSHIRSGKAHWSRTQLAVVDVLRAALAPQVTAAPAVGEEWLPIEPFREWLDELVARERRLTMRAIKDVRDRSGSYAEEGEGAVAARLGISERRLYRFRHEQARVSFGAAEACLTHSGEAIALEDLWPHLAISEDAA